ncbi:zinc finger, C2H2 type family protein (macronuclear) [Tetrahymena thermophila SB210]|uniref:Zinc finger, C2H2 type family protein n=1 Tax=Tetrahymena thermophila (strain SB210) TaxID=312017 RepID=Q235H3_TETTS|nr:zinc finger, C2H2 type family protein [Tetrahymena thermophila SB210]EAR92130.1 zinc finger, C2H2 type family protein [Tetrahymena thermophila SB210]|eukprot:XP_001012375.1 zinc finger, C2H2 type family protein [Tetrahymena thermophila SB210]
MSSSELDSSQQIGHPIKKKVCRDEDKNKNDTDIKEEYQDQDISDDEGEDLDSNSQKKQNSTNKSLDGQQIGNERSTEQSNGIKKLEIKSTYTYHMNNPNHIITNEPNDVEWECFDCNKKYKSYPAFYTHNKIKHNGNPPERYKIPRPLDSISKDRGRPKADTSTKQKFTDKDQKQHNLEDQIYEFLAKAGANDDQDNKIIRQYLNEPVNYIEAMPSFNLQDSNIQDNIQQIKKEIVKLIDLVMQYDDFQYIDPMELSDPQESEINLFNLKYLIQHYKQNNLINDFSLISIFISWIGKELRQDSYQEICLILIAYFTQYQNELKKLAKIAPDTRRDLLEKIHKFREYRYFLLAQQFKLFNDQTIFDFIGLFKIWIVFWIEQIYGDGIKVNTFSNKQEAPIILGSDEDEDNFDEDDDNDNEEDAAEENEDEDDDTNRKISKQKSNQNKKQNNSQKKNQQSKNNNNELENPENQLKQKNIQKEHIERNETNLGMTKVQVEEEA